MKKPTVAELQGEIEALKKRIGELEARPLTQAYPMFINPNQGPYLTPAWIRRDPYSPPWTVTCETTVAVGTPGLHT